MSLGRKIIAVAEGARPLLHRDLSPRAADRASGPISALAASNKVARISFGKDIKGDTGDPWTPIEIKDEERKALTINKHGFSYTRLSKILFEKEFEQVPLQSIGSDDRQECEYDAGRAGRRGRREHLCEPHIREHDR